MMDWFNSREPRERILLMILAGMLAIFVAWFILTRDSGPDGKSKLEAAQMDRELWLRAAPRIGAGATTGARSDFTRGALVEAARRRSVDLSRVEPQVQGGLSVWIDDAPTPALYGLINDLVTSYSVKVETAVLTTAPNGGVNAQLTLVPL